MPIVLRKVVLICLVIFMILSTVSEGCYITDDLKELERKVTEMQLEVDSLKTQREKWQDYDVKGAWYLIDTMEQLYEKEEPNNNYIRRIDFYEKPYIFFADNTMKTAIKYETDFDKVIIYDYARFVPLGENRKEVVFLSFHLKSKDTLICLTADHLGIYYRSN